MTIITLTNGKKVGNFNSPHDFIFEDGSVLPAVPKEKTLHLEMKFREEELTNGDIRIFFDITDPIKKEMSKWIELQYTKQVDIVFVPLPLLQLIHCEYPHQVQIWPFRTVRMVDRITKLASISKQCL